MSVLVRRRLALLALLAPLLAGVPAVAFAQGAGFGDEDRDWGIAPVTQVKRSGYGEPTPRELPGAKTVRTAELKTMLDQPVRPFLVDVLSGPAHRTLQGAVWLNNGGLGDYDAAEEKRFLDVINLFAGGDKAKPLVFFCSSAQCWLSYNAALRAVKAGYSAVMWYRGGIESWRLAGHPVSMSDPFPW